MGQKNTGFMFIDKKYPTPIKDKQLLIKHVIFKFIINHYLFSVSFKIIQYNKNITR